MFLLLLLGDCLENLRGGLVFLTELCDSVIVVTFLPKLGGFSLKVGVSAKIRFLTGGEA